MSRRSKSRRPIGTNLAAALVILLVVVGCGSDSTEPAGPAPGTAEFGGVWSFELEVVAKRTCGNEIGETFIVDATISREDDVATIVIDGAPTQLAIDGASASGTSSGELLRTFELSMNNDVIGGTLTLEDLTVPCTQVYGIVGTRVGGSCLTSGGCKITADDGAAFDRFGGRVALSGDGLVVGAPASGGAYAYRITGGEAVLERKLAPSAGGGFAIATVAMSGNTIVVGSQDDSSVTTRAGAAHVFDYAGGAWDEVQVLRASDPVVNQRFGREVAVDGDVVAVGAYNDVDIPFGSPGAVYVFRKNGNQYVQEQKLVPTDSAVADRFFEVAIVGDLIVVGASSLNAAYVFRFNGTNWVQEQKLTPSDALPGFGVSVATDGLAIVVGAPQSSVKGAVYIFESNGTSWAEQQKLSSAAIRAGFDFFGGSISVSGNRLVVGEYPSGGEIGAAYVYRLVGASWVPEKTLTARDDTGFDSISSVTVSGDIIVGGASNDDEMGTGAGAAYVFGF